MANLMDYLDWRGDLTLEQSPFNEVDNLILSELSFVDFQEIVPSPGSGKSVELRYAAESFFSRFQEGEKIDMGVLVPDEIPNMLRRMADSRRFGEMRLNCFVDWLDVGKGEQFAALTIETGDGRLYLSFRGTDDTLAGWREDFELACMPEVPAQKKALQYVEEVARQFPRKKLRLGGHSKGGNLAVYAGVFCPAAVQRRIAAVWSNDGPGFHTDLLDLPQHRRIAERIYSIVPKSSVVGMLLEHEEDYTVVAKFVDALFSVLGATGAVTLTDLKTDSLKATGAMAKAMAELDKETRDGLLRFLGILFKSNLRMVLEGIQEEKKPLLKRWSLKKKEES